LDSGRIKPGVRAPSFAVLDARGKEVTPGDFAGGHLWLIFSRFAACPFCSVRLHRISKEYERLVEAGVKALVLFPSPRDRVSVFIERYKPPFIAAADPEEKVFHLYGVEKSWAGEIRSAFQFNKVALALGAARQNPLAIDGSLHQMPADFLIGPDSTVEMVRYGSELDDGFSVTEVVSWARPSFTPASGPKLRGQFVGR
jgi:peroxiredoxin Q/BCP